MKIDKLLLILMLVFGFTQFVKADVAPNPDEMRMTANLIINTDADLSDYRFFLAFAVSVEEVAINSKGNTVLEPRGGSAAFSSGTLFAIPKRELQNLRQNPTVEELSLLIQSVEEKSTKGIKLGKHQFSQTIKAVDRTSWTYPTYKLEREGKTLKLTKLHDISPKISLEEEFQINQGNIFTFTSIAGLLVALAILITGVLLFRKVSKKG